jgi:DNA-directed RNA polymerase specialized sigma24 family protein
VEYILASEHDRREPATELWHRTTLEAARVAYLLGADIDTADGIARRAFRRASFLWMDRRDPYLFSTWLLRFTIKAVSHRDRLHLLRRPHRRSNGTGSSTAPKSLYTGVDSKLRRPFERLRHRHRAVVVLVHYNGLGLEAVADVLQTSVAGASALLRRALDDMGAGPDSGADLGHLLAHNVGQISPPDRDKSDVRRLHRISHALGAAILVAAACAIGAGGWVLASRVGTAAQTSQAEAPAELAEAEPLVKIPASELMGAPGWCPTVSGSLPVHVDNGIEAVGVATRLNLGLINGYKSSVRHLLDWAPGAPRPSSWPTTVSDTGLRIAFSAPAEANRVLAGICGNLVARRTWEVILEDSGPPHDDGVAFYLVRRTDGMKVWGTNSGQ